MGVFPLKTFGWHVDSGRRVCRNGNKIKGELPVQAFLMTPKMSTLQGVFYPTGYAFLMFPDAVSAEQAARELEAAGFRDQNIMLLPPEVILQEIGLIDGSSAMALPSVGTEGATVRKYIDFARDGHHALMVKAPGDKETERMMTIVRKLPFSYGQKYHLLAIEDLE
ncbi:MAG: RNA-binding protein [Polaromonas sp.]